MSRFRLSTLLALPMVIASGHLAVVLPFAATIGYAIVGITLIAYALTSKQTATRLDVEFTPWLCLFIRLLVSMHDPAGRTSSRSAGFAWNRVLVAELPDGKPWIREVPDRNQVR